MTGPISRNRLLGSLKEAAGQAAHRNTVVTLATVLVAARAEREGSCSFRICPNGTPPMPRRRLCAASSRSARAMTWPRR